MDITTNVLEALSERMSQSCYMEWASEYGEPGYGSSSTKGVILGSYWCHCDNGPETKSGLHSLDFHYPRLFAALTEQGFELEWYDEWVIDHDADKAYRTKPDSYSWQPSIVWNEEMSDWMTPETDVEEWVEWASENPVSRIIPSKVIPESKLEEIGFREYTGPDGKPQTFENGWHPGQTDDPKEIVQNISEELGEDTKILFYLNDTGQFDIRFSAWIRTEEE